MTWDAIQVITTLFSQCYQLMNSFVLPGTNATPWQFFMFIIRFSLILLALKTLLQWDIGTVRSKYHTARMDGKTFRRKD